MRHSSLAMALGVRFLGACANMSSLRTCKALDPGKGRVAVGGGYYTSPDVSEAVSEATSTDAELRLRSAEMMYRRGLIERLEAGLKVIIPGTVALDGKYQLVGLGGLTAAVGL